MAPHEARAFWLEKEVDSLKKSLAKMSGGNSFQDSQYWSQGFQPPPPGPATVSWTCEQPAAMSPPIPNLAERLSREVPGDAGLHSAHVRGQLLGGSGEFALHARAGMDSSAPGHHQRHLLGGSGEGSLHDRAGMDSSAQGHHQRHSLGGSGEGSLHDRAGMDGMAQGHHHGHLLATAAGDGHRLPDRAGTLSSSRHGECQPSELPPQARALQGTSIGASGLHDFGPGSFPALPRHGVGGGGLGEGLDRVYGPWTGQEGGSMNTKSELPDLPSSSSPLQFGDWLHLSTPSMKDISGVAGWWWESTLREAKAYYERWKESTPLQRIQIVPKLPESLCEIRFQRTEQRGVQMLLKAIPTTEQQELVTDRALSSTAILYKLMVRFQPGGAGEKQILLQQLTSMPRVSTAHEVASAVRNWRRHFGRAQEVQAVLPDGVLLVKALDEPLQRIAALDQQAAFRLSQSRMQLQLDEKPEHGNLWAFSQCLLAEAETLCLMATAPKSEGQTPLKLKPMDAMGTTFSKRSPTDGHGQAPNNNGKGKGSSIAETPCKWFRSDAGCRAGKNCKWSHSWEGVEDRNSRCFVCGSKEHRKADCKVRGQGGGKRNDETKVSGGGSAGSTTSTTNASASSPTPSTFATPIKPKIQEMSTSATTNSPGELKTGDLGSENGDKNKDLGEGAGDGGRNDRTSELLQEATQLLRTLRVAPGNAKMRS